jgi:hypothetical protein
MREPQSPPHSNVRFNSKSLTIGVFDVLVRSERRPPSLFVTKKTTNLNFNLEPATQDAAHEQQFFHTSEPQSE